MNKSLIYILAVLLVFSCKKEKTNNPFDDIEVITNETPDFSSVEKSNFAYLHEKIFSPTCANSGCHDGTFEPEFRSIAGSYNSLVNHAVISNDAANSYTTRVLPGNPSESLLNARLTDFLPNTSGIMPLEVDEDSDWNENSTDYISRIQQWITSGAPDMYGNLPGIGTSNLPPSINGLLAFPSENTTTPYERDPNAAGITPILVQNSMIDIWILVEDDQTPASEFSFVEISTATAIDDLSELNSSAFSLQPALSALDFSGNSANYIYKASLNLSNFDSGTVIYLRNYLNDGNSASNTEIPNSNSTPVIISLFALEIL